MFAVRGLFQGRLQALCMAVSGAAGALEEAVCGVLERSEAEGVRGELISVPGARRAFQLVGDAMGAVACAELERLCDSTLFYAGEVGRYAARILEAEETSEREAARETLALLKAGARLRAEAERVLRRELDAPGPEFAAELRQALTLH